MATPAILGNSRVATILAPTGGISVGDEVQIDKMFGVAIEDASEGAIAKIAVEGMFTFIKDETITTQAGEVMYWNPSTGYVDNIRDKPDKVPIGWAMVDTDVTDAFINVMLCPSVQLLPVVGNFNITRDIDPNPSTITDPLCTVGAQVVLTPIDGAAASIPFWAVASDGSFDIYWEESPNAYTSVNADGSSNAATTTPVVIDLIEDVGSLNFTVDTVANTVTVDVSGLYDFRLAMNGTASRNTTYIFRARINGTPVGQPITFVMSGNIDDFSFSSNGFFPFTVGDVIDFTVETASGSGTINYNQWSLVMLRAGTTTPEWTTAAFNYLIVGN